MTPEQLHRLFNLLGALRDETITIDAFSELNRMLDENSDAQDVYLDYIYLCTDLCNLQAATKKESCFCDSPGNEQENWNLNNPPLTLEMLRVWGDYEKNAEILELPKHPKKEKIIVEKIPVNVPPRQISKMSMITLATAIAAVLMLILYVHLHPRVSYEVATLSDAINAQWSFYQPLQKGTRLSVSSAEPIQLKKGVIEIESDKNVIVTIEAPAEFSFISPDEILMNYGRLYASVPLTGSGFSVQTQNAKIIDLGTEFGIYANQNGQTELHMFKGKSALIAELQNKTKKVLDVLAGQAYELNRSSKDVRNILLSETGFAKAIDSESNLIWRGQKEINLADIVGGGNGLGTGRCDTGINPNNAKYGVSQQLTRKMHNTYKPVPSSVFIDGVFVPNGFSEQTVTSNGLVFKECPNTSGFFYTDITNTPSLVGTGDTPRKYPVLLDNVNYSAKTNSFIFLHANLGITYDLNAFRSRLPETDILEFSSDIGISNSAPFSSTASFWVLIDGQVRYHQDVSAQGLADTAKIELNEKDRFLTLMATDGGVTDPQSDRNAIGYDWCVFGNPVLNLK